MEQSPRLSLSYILPQQAQKHVTANESFRRLDALCQLSVRSRTIAAEPSSPAEGDAYILPASPSGTAWDNFTTGNVATYQDGAWIEISAVEGLRAWLEDERTLAVFTASAWKTAAREVLTADRTYYVRSDGDDGNDGLSNAAGGAFATVQKAIDTLYDGIDWNGYDATIQLAGSTATFTQNLSFVGMPPGVGTVTLTGDTTTPSTYTLAASSNIAVNLSQGARVSIEGVKLTASSRCLNVLSGSVATISGNMEFGACSGGRHISAGDGGSVVNIASGYIVSGAAADHLNINGNASLSWTAGTVTLSGTPAFSGRFIKVTIGASAIVLSSAVAFSGSATGKRYEVDKVSALETFGGGAAYFPGDSAGTADAATFGYYG